MAVEMNNARHADPASRKGTDEPLPTRLALGNSETSIVMMKVEDEAAGLLIHLVVSNDCCNLIFTRLSRSSSDCRRVIDRPIEGASSDTTGHIAVRNTLLPEHAGIGVRRPLQAGRQRTSQIWRKAGDHHHVTRARRGARRIPLEANLDFLRVAIAVLICIAVFTTRATTRRKFDARLTHQRNQIHAGLSSAGHVCACTIAADGRRWRHIAHVAAGDNAIAAGEVSAVDHFSGHCGVVAHRNSKSLIVGVIRLSPLIEKYLSHAHIFRIALHVATDHHCRDDHANDDQHHCHFHEGKALLAPLRSGIGISGFHRCSLNLEDLSRTYERPSGFILPIPRHRMEWA
ncbi:hypothetical protein DFR41_1082 [Pseudacidovorax intermedius]|uniref:Uncharacterized protein n=1 Tax=Pseudacidovorax intermedius TaxID=433924 RepID=A0A370FA71_9BURK|nr:hypothetical protein DFR41_1082 [Pseudacidovorax intermedius]